MVRFLRVVLLLSFWAGGTLGLMSLALPNAALCVALQTTRQDCDGAKQGPCRHFCRSSGLCLQAPA